MDTILFLVLRRMRAPLLALIVTYAVAVLGLVLIPGRDPDGNVWHMDIFHAFYFVSYMSSTIGFGEIPYPFTDAQRLWVTFSIFGTVIVWLYSIGKVLTLFQDKAFQQALTERHFARHVRGVRDPFHLICGYGETGSTLIRALSSRNQLATTIDIDEARISLLQLENLRQYVPALCGDAGLPQNLTEAGLLNPRCSSVVALTNQNEVNLRIAITAKLLRPGILVICRADSHDVEANMASFGTDHIIDPYDTFATHLAIALRAPCLYLLHNWLTGEPEDHLPEPIYPPGDGLWVLCGYGRFGKAVYERLCQQGGRVIVIEKYPEQTGMPEDGCVIGRGTEATTLQEARIGEAVGIVAGTDDDANNLSIIMTARELNPDLFVILRQNQQHNREIIDAVAADVIMHPSSIIANKIRVLLGMPLLSRFADVIADRGDDWACPLISRISALVGEHVPSVWEVTIDADNALAAHQAIRQREWFRLGTLMRDPSDRDRMLRCIPLLLERDGESMLMPDEGIVLREDDRILFCGSHRAGKRIGWALQNVHSLNYLRTGESRPQGWIWRLFQRGHGQDQ